MLTTAAGLTFLLDGTVKFVFASRTIAFTITDTTESYTSIVGTRELIFSAMISRTVLFILAVRTVGFAITDLVFIAFC